jgi:hypothetical protein
MLTSGSAIGGGAVCGIACGVVSDIVMGRALSSRHAVAADDELDFASESIPATDGQSAMTRSSSAVHRVDVPREERRTGAIGTLRD